MKIEFLNAGWGGYLVNFHVVLPNYGLIWMLVTLFFLVKYGNIYILKQVNYCAALNDKLSIQE